MAYMNKNAELKNGYNAYIDSSVDDMGTQMDVGLLLMEAGIPTSMRMPKRGGNPPVFRLCHL
ncbi:MAG: hypothetical protein ACLTYN_00260 [Dysosmobacter welbionis]